MNHVGVMAAALGFGHAAGLVSLWLRLRSRQEQDEAHHRFVVAVLRDLPPGTQLCADRPDGTRLTLSSGEAPDG